MPDKTKYEGILARPIKLPRIPLEFDRPVTSERGEEFARAMDRQQEEFRQAYMKILEARFEALFEHFGLSPRQWYALALKLAETHVPGFRIAPKSHGGRPEKWDYARKSRLADAVARIQGREKINEREALERLKIRQWKEWGEGIETLESRLQEGKSIKRAIELACNSLDPAFLEKFGAK
jgi:hypothetical protein